MAPLAKYWGRPPGSTPLVDDCNRRSWKTFLDHDSTPTTHGI